MSDLSNTGPKASMKSGDSKTAAQKIENYGGLPPKKDVEAIDKQNTPQGVGKAPGSVRKS